MKVKTTRHFRGIRRALIVPVRALGLLFVGLAAGWNPAVAAEPLRVAVAANFATTLETLAETFTAEEGVQVDIARGSTGKLFAQILNGAPFDLFFAADAITPAELEARGLAVAGSRFNFARGRLVLWSPDPEYIDGGSGTLRTASFRHLAIANPRVAPYGAAARETLEALGLWDALQPRLVRGENIGQAFQFVASGNAELGFVAASQLQGRFAGSGSFWMVPQRLHTPLDQHAVIVRPSDSASAFAAYVRSAEAREVIRTAGYDLPAEGADT